MPRNLLLSSRLREVFLNGHWIAQTNYKELLQSVNWQQATHQINQLNTIAALTFHINYYLEGLLNAFVNGTLNISDKYSFTLAPITSEVEWDILRSNLFTNAERFADRVEQLEDSQFDEIFINERYGTVLRNIEGVIEHSYYHLGQISLLRKMIIQHQQ